jgi:hypothetical protein
MRLKVVEIFQGTKIHTFTKTQYLHQNTLQITLRKQRVKVMKIVKVFVILKWFRRVPRVKVISIHLSVISQDASFKQTQSRNIKSMEH